MPDVLLLCAVEVEWRALAKIVVDGMESSENALPALVGRLGDHPATSVALVEVGMGVSNAAMNCESPRRVRRLHVDRNYATPSILKPL